MEHGGMTMATTTTAAAGTAATGAAQSMGGMGGMGGGNGCKISMLWNWNTIDSCFLASSWKITSNAVFAGSCIGVVLLVIVLEMLRRGVKEYDRFLIKKHAASLLVTSAASKIISEEGSPTRNCAPAVSKGYRPSIFEQAIRALLHMLQFAVAYFVMLLAMYYNGYIIICIFIGAYLGSFIFHWEPLGGVQQTSASQEATVCCG
ncbi:Ctr copper transporter family-domain-containing protein [Chaetomium sp. MPI-SDFR-AT-0129]|nr:Ctr copper transporter family-domain-containing protein [Chaetomium sp. MPI-SDFR-AT-0129]